MASNLTPDTKFTEEKPVKSKVKRYRTKSGQNEYLPKLGFVVNDEMLKKHFVIKAIENWEARTGKQAFGTVIVLD